MILAFHFSSSQLYVNYIFYEWFAPAVAVPPLVQSEY